jgi:predicted Zn finger-like uncharacterized protein
VGNPDRADSLSGPLTHCENASVVVQCPSCQTRFRVADEKVSDRGVRVRCSNCKDVFSVKKSGVSETGSSAGAGSAMDDLSSLDPPVPAAKKGGATGKVGAAAKPTTGRVSQPGGGAKTPGGRLDADDLFGMSELTGEAGGKKPRLTLDDLDLGDEPLVSARPKTSPVKPDSAGAGKPKTGPLAADSAKPKTGPLSAKPKTGPFSADAARPKTGPLGAEPKPKTGPLGAPSKPKTGPLADVAKPKTGPLGDGLAKPKTGPLSAQGAKPKTGPLADKPKTGPVKQAIDLPELPANARPNLELSSDPFEGLMQGGAAQAKSATDRQEKSDKQSKSDKQIDPAKHYKSIFKEKAEPPPSARRELFSSALTGLVGAALAVVVVIVAAISDEGSGGWLGFTSRRDVVATKVVSGLYDTSSGKPVFYIRGRVENRGRKTHGPVRVVAELLGDRGTDAKAEALAGAVPSPEDVYALRSVADAEKLQRSLQGVDTERKLFPGTSLPFFAVIADPPPDVQRHRLHVRVEPIDAWSPPRTAEVSK